MTLPPPYDVWDKIIDVLLGWRKERYPISSITIDNAITGCKALRHQSPAPSEVRMTSDRKIVMTFHSEFQTMYATYDVVAGVISFVTTGGEKNE